MHNMSIFQNLKERKILDKDGKIVAKNLRGKALGLKIQETTSITLKSCILKFE